MTFGHGKATLEMTGEHNRRIIFQLLRRYGQLSRQQLSDMTTLHRSTLSKIMSEFLKRNLVVVVGKAEPPVRRVGKKQILLRIRGEIGWTLGIGVNLEWMNMLVADAAGRVVKESRAHLGRDLTRLAAVAKAHFDSWLAADQRPAGPLLGVGVAVPGVVDSDSGKVVISDFFDIRNFGLAAAMSEAFAQPAYLDNDVRLEAQAQLNQPNETATGNFIFFHTNFHPKDGGYAISEFGSALVIQGRLYRGANSCAGELSGSLKPGDSNMLTESDLECLSADEAPLSDNLRQLAAWLAPYLALLGGYMDPHRIVIGGALHWRNRALLKMLEDLVNERILPAVVNRRLTIHPTRFPGQETAYGAAIMAFDHVPVTELGLAGTPG